jgi:diguanylate cyclase (GGDEF)-like protein
MRVRHTDLSWRRVRVTVTNMLADPAVGGIVTNSSDITEAHAYHSQLSHQASHDSLTDLANRSLFGEQLERALDGAGGRPVSLALVDLDDFKAVNDTLGHQAGDALLIAVAERLRRGVRPQDLVARIGGDEFAVLLDGVGATRVEAIAERMLGILTEPLRIDGHEVCVQASVGLAEAGPGDGAGQLLRLADVALYEAKGAGKGRYVRYAEHMQPRMSARAESAADLRRALQAGEFELYYQPIVALPSGRLTGVEALLRWHHPVRGLVPPLDFIPVAEQTGMIVPIGHWVLVQACRDMAAWLAQYPDTAPEVVNVNVAPRQLRHPGFVDEVFAALAKAGLPASRLVIELIESTIVGDVNPQLGRLREAGVRIALDDFGTGQSTLSLLDACPVDELKLDRSFVREPGQDKVATVVARMAEALGVYAVAEGVETREQAEHLHSLGYGLAQGFHFARPVPAADLTELLRRGSSLAATTAPAS